MIYILKDVIPVIFNFLKYIQKDNNNFLEY